MIKYIYGRVSSHQWVPDAQSGQPCGVLLRKSRGNYISEPEVVDSTLLGAVQTMNVEVAFTMATDTVNAILTSLQPGQTEIFLGNGSQLQIIDSLASISTSTKKLQYAALIREEQLMLVWHDDLDRIMNHAAKLEDKLLALVSDHDNFIVRTHQVTANKSMHRCGALKSPHFRSRTLLQPQHTNRWLHQQLGRFIMPQPRKLLLRMKRRFLKRDRPVCH